MNPPNPPKPLSLKQAQAAILVAEDELSDVMIARTIGICKATLENWKKAPLFALSVQSHVKDIYDCAKSAGIAQVEDRLRRQHVDRARLRRVILERAEYWTLRRERVTAEIVVMEAKVPGLQSAYDAVTPPAPRKRGQKDTPEVAAERVRFAKVSRELQDAKAALHELQHDPALYPGICEGTTLYSREETKFGVNHVFKMCDELPELRALEAQTEKTLGQTTPVKQTHDVNLRDLSAAAALDSKLAGLAAATSAAGVPSEPVATGGD